MYRSLFSVLKSHVYNGESGVLSVDYLYGGESRIYLKEGLVEGIETNGETGPEAVKICTRWISISTHFSKEIIDLPEKIKSVDTSSFLSLLEKVYTRIQKIQKIVPGNNALFKIDAKRLDNIEQFSSQELKISLLLDGSRSIERVMSETGISELEVLIIIHKLSKLGVARLLTVHKPMEKEQRESFLKSLLETLSESVGPVADVLINNAFESMGFESDLLSEAEMPRLIETICANLEDEEKTILEKWSESYLPDDSIN